MVREANKGNKRCTRRHNNVPQQHPERMDDEDFDPPVEFWQEELEVDDAIMAVVMDSSSSDEERRRETAGKKEKSPNKKRDFLAAYERIRRFYFNGRESVYDEKDFERRFRCPRSVFCKIHDEIMGCDPFNHYTDTTGKPGIYPLVKLVGCFRYLAYGDAYDRDDENLSIGETTLRDIVKEFTQLVVKKFGSQYLNRFPTDEEKKAISTAIVIARTASGSRSSVGILRFFFVVLFFRFLIEIDGFLGLGREESRVILQRKPALIKLPVHGLICFVTISSSVTFSSMDSHSNIDFFLVSNSRQSRRQDQEICLVKLLQIPGNIVFPMVPDCLQSSFFVRAMIDTRWSFGRELRDDLFPKLIRILVRTLHFGGTLIFRNLNPSLRKIKGLFGAPNLSLWHSCEYKNNNKKYGTC